MPARSTNLVSSGFAAALAGTGGGRRYILVLTNDPDFARALYEGLIPRDRIAGIFCPASFGDDSAPFTTAISAPSNMALGGLSYPYYNPYQSTGLQTGYAYDVTTATWDGMTGIQANFMPIGEWRELYWAEGADVALNAEICTFTLDVSSFAPQVDSIWHERALSVTTIVHSPATNTSGSPTLPIQGGPSLKQGLRRGVASYTLGSASSLTTAAGYVGLTGTLAAGSGAPSASLNNGATTTNRGRRCIPVGTHFRIADPTISGIELVILGWKTARHASLGGLDAANVGMDPNVCVDGIAAVLGISRFDAVLVDCHLAIEHSFFAGDIVDHLSGLATGDPGIPSGGTGGTWGEYCYGDFGNSLDNLTTVGTSCPRCWINTHPSGHIHAVGLVSPALSVAATIAETQDIDALYAVNHPSDTVFGTNVSSFVNWRAFCGLTQQQVLTSPLVNRPGTTYGGIWSAGSKSLGTIWCHTDFGNPLLDPVVDLRTGATRWFVVTAASTTKEPGVDAGWDDDWDELDLSATLALNDQRVAFLQTEVETSLATGALCSIRPNVTTGVSLHLHRPNS